MEPLTLIRYAELMTRCTNAVRVGVRELMQGRAEPAHLAGVVLESFPEIRASSSKLRQVADAARQAAEAVEGMALLLEQHQAERTGA